MHKKKICRQPPNMVQYLWDRKFALFGHTMVKRRDIFFKIKKSDYVSITNELSSGVTSYY